MLQCTMASGRPQAWSPCRFPGRLLGSSFSSTAMAKMDVPAETLPVRTGNAVGGGHARPGVALQAGTAAHPAPVPRRDPAAVRPPPSAPRPGPRPQAFGRISPSRQGQTALLQKPVELMDHAGVEIAIPCQWGTYRRPPPTPSTLSPVSFQCTYPASVVR